jgi:hypothetical protein
MDIVLLHCPPQKCYKIAGTELGDGNMDISHMLWYCIWLGDAMLLHCPLQKSSEIPGTKFWDGNMDIVHMWQCIWIKDGDSGNINSPPSILMHCHSISEKLIFPFLNSMPDISYDLWSGRCNNIASLSHMQYHSMWEISIFPSPNSVPTICKIFEVGDAITLPDSSSSI